VQWCLPGDALADAELQIPFRRRLVDPERGVSVGYRVDDEVELDKLLDERQLLPREQGVGVFDRLPQPLALLGAEGGGERVQLLGGDQALDYLVGAPARLVQPRERAGVPSRQPRPALRVPSRAG
jgi:hypothetical protein